MERWSKRRDENEPKEERFEKRNMQNGVGDEVVITGCPWKAQTSCITAALAALVSL